MSRFTDERLWQLLPAIYRIRDEQTGALQALIKVLAEQARVVESDIDQLLANLFIETCEEWVVPYIGDLLGVTNLHPFASEASFSQRARVANTLAYRRRKGTAPVLEQLAFDTTGWRSRAVEYFLRLDTTQHINHVRADHVRTLDLRDSERLELIGGAFDPASYTVDVRPIAEGAPRQNIPNIGLFLWRLSAYPIARSEARPHAAPVEGRYTFDPLGLDVPLFNRPQTETEITHLATEINVPAALRRRPLYDELEARRQVKAEEAVFGDERSIEAIWFDDPDDSSDAAVLEVFFDANANGTSFQQVPSHEIMICDLSGWDAAGWTPPADLKNYTVTLDDGSTVTQPMDIRAFVDPQLGRVAFPASVTPALVDVSYAYGFSGDYGAGSYRRDDDSSGATVALAGTNVAPSWYATVAREGTYTSLGLSADAANGPHFTSLVEAVLSWNQQTTRALGIIALLDNSMHTDDLIGPNAIKITEGHQLTIVAAEWPKEPSGLAVERDERRALIRGAIQIEGAATDAPGKLKFDGLVIERRVEVMPGQLGRLEFENSTLVEGVQVDTATAGSHNGELELVLRRTITAPLIASNLIRSVLLEDCVLHERSLLASVPAAGGVSLAGDVVAGESAPATTFERTTVFGRVLVEELDASETIFRDAVVAERLQEGCVRFSFVPIKRLGNSSRTPRRYRCQPDLALNARAAELGVERKDLPTDEAARVIATILPQFTTTAFGSPGFAQLTRACPVEIRTGAEDGAEMGVFSLLKNPQRVANLEASLAEYLRLGLESGIIFAT